MSKTSYDILDGDDYVSRGGLKLAKALDFFNVSPKGKVCIDCGASTGGFTDCLLQNGAIKVYAIDVGYGQLAWTLRNDARVVTMERTNIRYVTPDTLEEASLKALKKASQMASHKASPKPSQKAKGDTDAESTKSERETEPTNLEQTSIELTKLEQTNIELANSESTNLESAKPELTTIDVSFISLALVLPVIRNLMVEESEVIALIKPQFEAGKGKVGKNGVVRNPEIHKEVLDAFVQNAEKANFFVKGLTFSPLKGPKGNIEYLGWLQTNNEMEKIDTELVVKTAHKELGNE